MPTKSSICLLPTMLCFIAYLMENLTFFFNPKKNRFETCVAFENATGEERIRSLERTEIGNKGKKAAENLIVAFYDMRAVF